ncbi:ATP-binding protein [Streptomyces sp. CA-294286]|uniref:ATP-binding protein n=1 Tax=Streptomyces sp. CA-294286 TaxID=3240070 RepID=UPI003D8DAEC8
MSTTRQHPPGDLGPEPDGIASVSEASADAPASVSGTSVPEGSAALSDTSVSEVSLSGGPTSRREAGDPGAEGAGAGTAGFGVAAEPAARVARESVEQVRSLPLNGASGIVPLARDFTRQALYDWGWLPASTADRKAAAEDVLLVVSELVTNACLHAEGPDSLRVSSDGKVLRLEVTDRSAGEPSPRSPHQAGRPGGHGMFIVQRLCLDWGVVRTPEGVGPTNGKTVWAELAAPAP